MRRPWRRQKGKRRPTVRDESVSLSDREAGQRALAHLLLRTGQELSSEVGSDVSKGSANDSSIPPKEAMNGTESRWQGRQYIVHAPL